MWTHKRVSFSEQISRYIFAALTTFRVTTPRVLAVANILEYLVYWYISSKYCFILPWIYWPLTIYDYANPGFLIPLFAAGVSVLGQSYELTHRYRVREPRSVAESTNLYRSLPSIYVHPPPFVFVA